MFRFLPLWTLFACTAFAQSVEIDDEKAEQTHVSLEDESLDLRNLLLQVRAAEIDEDFLGPVNTLTDSGEGAWIFVEVEDEAPEPSQEVNASSTDETLLLDTEDETLLLLDD